MNPGISIRFGTRETHKRPPHLGGNGEHFTYFLPIPNNQGTCSPLVFLRGGPPC
jgi:hypothetical protein